MTQHLTEEEFADYLLGLSTAATQAHLLECDHCRREMESFGGSLAAFNQTSMAWSREVAAAHPVRSDAQPAGKRSGRSVWQRGWAVGLAAAAVLVFAVALPVVLHRQAAPTEAAHVVAPVPQVHTDDAGGIAEDNRIMAAIDAEISQPEASPLESFAAFRSGLETTQDHAAASVGRRAERKNN